MLLHLRRPQRDVLTFLDPDGAGCEPCDLVTLLVPESYDRFPDRVAMVVVPVNDAVVDHPHLPPLQVVPNVSSVTRSPGLQFLLLVLLLLSVSPVLGVNSDSGHQHPEVLLMDVLT